MLSIIDDSIIELEKTLGVVYSYVVEDSIIE